MVMLNGPDHRRWHYSLYRMGSLLAMVGNSYSYASWVCLSPGLLRRWLHVHQASSMFLAGLSQHLILTFKIGCSNVWLRWSGHCAMSRCRGHYRGSGWISFLGPSRSILPQLLAWSVVAGWGHGYWFHPSPRCGGGCFWRHDVPGPGWEPLSPIWCLVICCATLAVVLKSSYMSRRRHLRTGSWSALYCIPSLAGHIWPWVLLKYLWMQDGT